LIFLRDGLLEKYSFTRNKFDSDDAALLTENEEVGGLVSLDGLGFEITSIIIQQYWFILSLKVNY
jgi:hypothetical protein